MGGGEGAMVIFVYLCGLGGTLVNEQKILE